MTTDSLRNRTIGDYLDALSARAAAPGGGSVAGIAAALSAGLGSMVVRLSDKGEPDLSLVEALPHLTAAIDLALDLAAQDEQAYGGYVQASKRPKGTVEEKAQRNQAMQEAIVSAAEVPLNLAEAARDILLHLTPVARFGTIHALSDATLGVWLAEFTVKAALLNVRTNLALIKDPTTVTTLSDRAATVEATTAAQVKLVSNILSDRNTPRA